MPNWKSIFKRQADKVGIKHFIEQTFQHPIARDCFRFNRCPAHQFFERDDDISSNSLLARNAVAKVHTFRCTFFITFCENTIDQQVRSPLVLLHFGHSLARDIVTEYCHHFEVVRLTSQGYTRDRDTAPAAQTASSPC